MLDNLALPTHLAAQSTESVALRLSGSGTASDPYVIEGDAYFEDPTLQLLSFDVPGVYEFTRPTFGTYLMVVVAGGGGGGAGANIGDYQELGVAGGGGAPGQEVYTQVQIADLPLTTTLVVGSGGAGGSRATDTTMATAGIPGTPSSWGTLAAAGGAGGAWANTTPLLPGYGGHGAVTNHFTLQRVGMPGHPGVHGARLGGGAGGNYNQIAPGGGDPGLVPARRGGGGGGGGASWTRNNPANDKPISSPAGSGGPGFHGGGGGGGGAGRATVTLTTSPTPGNGGKGGDGLVAVLIQ